MFSLDLDLLMGDPNIQYNIYISIYNILLAGIGLNLTALIPSSREHLG